MIKRKKKEASSSITWNPTEERFVGYIDIMGFKDRVARNSHEEIYSMMKGLKESLDLFQDTFAINSYKEGEDKLVSMTTYSDSIMIYSKDATKDSFESFIWVISALYDDLISQKIPHKGAIAFGKMTLDFENSIFFGQPLIDAYLLQEELNFYGIVCHATAENKIIGNPNGIYLYEYPCPFKNGSATHYAVCPMTLTINEEILKKVRDLKSITSGSLRKYIDNTLEFLKKINPPKI